MQGTSPQCRSCEELIAAVNTARPGTVILIAPGEYREGLSFGGLRGSKGKPITLTALDESNPPSIVGGASGLHLTSPSYVELRNLVLRNATGNGLNIDDAGVRENDHGVGPEWHHSISWQHSLLDLESR